MGTGGRGGGAKQREGGHLKFYPYEKGGGAEKVLAILKRGGKSFHSLKGGRKKSYPVLTRGGAQKVSDPRFSHFVAPPSP